MCNDKQFSSANTGLNLDLPDWAVQELNQLPSHLTDEVAQMSAVIRFAQRNFEEGTGGPFAAGIFEDTTGKLVVIGVNRVVPFNCSSAHAEVVALSLAQRILGHYDLGAKHMPAYKLVVNWSPCAMCFGAVLWSGIRSLVIAGAGPEMEAITGFDEGPMHPEWRQELSKRGIEFKEGVLQDQAISMFKHFAASNSFVYNARLGQE